MAYGHMKNNEISIHKM